MALAIPSSKQSLKHTNTQTDRQATLHKNATTSVLAHVTKVVVRVRKPDARAANECASITTYREQWRRQRVSEPHGFFRPLVNSRESETSHKHTHTHT